MNNQNILVTGGAGYIGSHTLVELYNSGYNPIVVDNLCNSSYDNITGAEQIIKSKIDFYEVDCTDFEKMDKVFKEQKDIDAVIHFAAFKSVEESVRQPNKYFSNNIGSLETLLNLMNSIMLIILFFLLLVPCTGRQNFYP